MAPAIFATVLYPYRNNAPVFTATALPVTGDGVWGQTLNMPGDTTEVAIVKDGSAKTFSFKLPSGEAVKTEAAGVVLRRSPNGEKVFVGGWNLRSYSDGYRAFTLDAPGNIAVSGGGNPGRMLFFNGGDKSATITLTKPFARTATLPPGAWTEVSPVGQQPVSSPPSLFPPLG